MPPRPHAVPCRHAGLLLLPVPRLPRRKRGRRSWRRKTSNFPASAAIRDSRAVGGARGRDHGAGRGPWRGRGRRAGKRRAAASPLRNAVPQPLLHSSAGKRHALVVVAVLQNEAPFVAEWLEYHRLPHVGVSHFYLYDDGSTDGLQAVLAPYVGAGLVTLHPIGVAGELPTLLESAVETPTCAAGTRDSCSSAPTGCAGGPRLPAAAGGPAPRRQALRDGAEAVDRRRRVLACRVDAPASESIAASPARRNVKRRADPGARHADGPAPAAH